MDRYGVLRDTVARTINQVTHDLRVFEIEIFMISEVYSSDVHSQMCLHFRYLSHSPGSSSNRFFLESSIPIGSVGYHNSVVRRSIGCHGHVQSITQIDPLVAPLGGQRRKTLQFLPNRCELVAVTWARCAVEGRHFFGAHDLRIL